MTTSLGVPDMAQRKFFVAFATLALSATLGCVVVASLAAQDKKGPSGGEKSASEKTGEKPAADKAKEPANVNEMTAAFDKLHDELLDTIKRLAELQKDYRLA